MSSGHTPKDPSGEEDEGKCAPEDSRRNVHRPPKSSAGESEDPFDTRLRDVMADDGCLLPSDGEVEQKNIGPNQAGEERRISPP